MDGTAAPRLEARIAGVAYLFVIAGGIFAEAFVRGALVEYGDAGATARNIIAHEGLYRAGLAADLVNIPLYTIVTAILYLLFKPVSRTLSLVAAMFSVVGIAIGSTVMLFHYAPLPLLRDPSYVNAFRGGDNHALALLFIHLHGMGYDVSLVCFGCYCLLIGYLIVRSTFLPGLIGLLMAFAGAGYLTSTFARVLAVPLPEWMSAYVLLPGLVGEGALTLWLIVFGVNAARWQEQAGASRAPRAPS